MSRSFVSTFAALSSLLFATACGQSENGDTSPQGAPELSAVQMALTDDTESEALATSGDSVDGRDEIASALEAATPAPKGAPDLLRARGKISELNQSIREAFQPIVAMVRNQEPSSQIGRTQMWGPVIRGATEYRFFLRHASGKRYGWRLDGRLADEGGKYAPVAAGEIVVGAIARRGIGSVGIDLNTLAAVDPSFEGQGQLLLGFKHGPKGHTIGYGMKGFTRNPATTPPMDALLRSVHVEPNINRVRLAYHGNVEGTATDAEELVLARLRHVAGIGGRSDMVVLQGDIPEATAWVISECWNKQLESAFRTVRSCPISTLDGADCALISTKGDDQACAKDLRVAERPPLDPASAIENVDTDAESVTVPETLPNVTIDD